jgi:hypothetical protein
MKRLTTAVLFAATVALASPAVAAQSATLVLRSGERIGGELVDMGAGGLTFRVNGQNRQYPTGQVAVIDFAGGGTNFNRSELDQVGDGGVVTTSGETVKGRLYDVGGSEPLKITIDLPGGGTREYRSTELKRIYLARPSGSTTSTGTTQPTTSTTATGATSVRIPATTQWVDTGLTVRRGESVRFNASGQVQLSSDSNDTATPAGSRSGRRPAGGPMPQVLAGALIGRIGPVQTFGIGNQTTALSMPADGRLFIGINDDNVNDNHGEFQVEIMRTAGVLQRR